MNSTSVTEFGWVEVAKGRLMDIKWKGSCKNEFEPKKGTYPNPPPLHSSLSIIHKKNKLKGGLCEQQDNL